MTMQNPPRLTARTVFLILLTVALNSGCLKHEPEPSRSFVEDWQSKAEQGAPLLPPQQVMEAATPGKTAQNEVYDQTRTLTPTDHQSAPLENIFAVTDLPKEKITVRFVDMDLATTLRTLASIAKQNIVIDPGINGPWLSDKGGSDVPEKGWTVRIHLEVTDQPWDSVFMGIIHNYDLTINKEGNLLRVMRQADVVSRKTLQRQSEAASHYITRTVPINFINLVKPKSQRFSWSSGSSGGSGGGSSSSSSSFDPVDEFIEKTIKPMLSSPGPGKSSISYDRHSSRLLIRETEENMDNILKCIIELDRPTPQILIKAHIVETTKDTARELGIQWGALSTNVLGDPRVHLTPGSSSPSYLNGQLVYPPAGPNAIGNNVNLGAATIAGIDPASIGLIANGSDLLLHAQLSALQKDGRLNILSSPSIATLDNSEATISSGKEVPFQTVDADGKISIEYKDASLELMVIPHVVSTGMITLNIEAKKNEVDPVNKVNGNPLIIKKMAKTQLIVENNATVVLAGLSKETSSGSNAGVPGLKEVPGLGWLFKKDSTSQEFEELLIFITPKVLTKPGAQAAEGTQP